MAGFVAAKVAQVPGALQRFVDAGDVSGFVTLTWRDGEIAQLNTLGFRELETKRPMQRDTLFRIASMSKPVTSVATLMLIEEGKCRLDDPITKWAPELANLRVLRKPDGPLDGTYAAPRPITIEDLMTHRSGLAYAFTSVGPIAKAYERALGKPLPPDEWLKALGELPLVFAPGERFHYSHSTDVLGFLVGRIAGNSFRDFLVSRVFGPLGMHDTDFYVPSDKSDRAATVYRYSADQGSLEAVPFPNPPQPPTFCGGGGGLIATVDDYLKFAVMLLRGGALGDVRLLTRRSVELMATNRLTPAQRAIPFMGMPFWAGQGFGLGLSVITDPEKQAWMGMGSEGAFGWPGAFGTWWQADPREDLVMIYMIQNSLPLGPDMASQLATGQRLGVRAALPAFQRLTYAALA